MKAIQILGKTYKIEYVDEKALAGNYGDCSTKFTYIRINKEIARQHQEDTLLHEVIHIISNELTLELTEQQTRQLATVLYSIGVRL